LIAKIDNRNINVAQQIYLIFQASYKVEAEILNVSEFPPLSKSVIDFTNSDNNFFAFYVNKNIAGLIEVDYNNKSTHIQSLVVNPKFFRQGIGRELVNFVLKTFNSMIFTVETGLANKPAINLYISCGFKEDKQFDTNHGVRKIRLIKL